MFVDLLMTCALGDSVTRSVDHSGKRTIVQNTRRTGTHGNGVSVLVQHGFALFAEILSSDSVLKSTFRLG